MLFVKNKEGKFKAITVEELVEKLQAAKQQIETADSYAGELKHGNGCDSSDDCRFRMAYVEKAETEFVKNSHQAILALAAEMVQKDLGSLAAVKEGK